MPPASLTVVKNDTTDSNTSFGFTSTPTPPLSSFNLQDPSNKTKTFASIPAGSYSVTEDNKDGWTLDSVVCTSTLNSSTFTYSGRTANITLQPGDSVTCTYTNSPIIPDVGRIKIIKTVDAGGSSFTSGTFEVTASCGEAGTFVKDIMYPAPGFIEIGDLPTGTECTVTETDKPTPPSDYSWGSEVITGSPATVTFQGTATVTVANKLTRDLGSLEITKTLDVGGSNFDTTTTFAISYECTLAGVVTKSGTANLAKDGVATITGIPTGSVCTVTEPAFPGAPTGYSWSKTITGSPTAAITKDGTATVTVANKLTRDLGSLEITKTLDVGGSNFDTTTTFAISYECTLAGVVTKSGTANLAKDGVATITGIPTGSVCTVTEPAFPGAPTGYSWSKTITGSPTAAITKDGTATVTVANKLTRDLGSLEITKTLDVGGSNFDTTTTFAISYECTLAGVVTKSGTANLAKDGVATITGIPTGSVCTVTEPAFPGAPTGYSWSKTITGSPTAAITKDGTATVTVANKLTRDLGSLEITKIFDPKTSGFTGKFSITVDCDVDSFDQTLMVGAGETKTISGIPTGTKCTVSEPSLPTDPTGWTFGTPVLDPASGQVTIATRATTYTVKVTNSITRDTGSIRIEKTVNKGTSNFTSGSFGFTLTCTNPTATYTTTVVYPTPGFNTVNNIPTGSVCTISETSKPTPPSGYSWQTPVISPNPVTVTTKGATVTVKVTNSLTKTALTPGYWKNHLDQAFALLPNAKLGNTYTVSTKTLATKVYNAMNCSSSKPNDAIGCLAGHLLSTKYNLANGTDACIAAVVTKADAFLSGQVVDGVTGINYVGPAGNYSSLTAAQRNLAISLKNALDKYNNNGGC